MTGYMALELWKELMEDFDTHYPKHGHLKDEFQKLGDTNLSEDDIFKNLKNILNSLKK